MKRFIYQLSKIFNSYSKRHNYKRNGKKAKKNFIHNYQPISDENYHTFNPNSNSVFSPKTSVVKERVYNPFKKNLSSIPSFDQLLPYDEVLMIENDSSTRHHEVIDESDLELQDEIDNLDIDSSDDQSKPSMALTQMSP